ncbi:MAG: hypothetical protein ACI8R9_000225 [Paraglaciecola sp.]|jgi:hypothetical protein
MIDATENTLVTINNKAKNPTDQQSPSPVNDKKIKNNGRCSQLTNECELMCEYALTNGLEVPPQLIKNLYVITNETNYSREDIGELAIIHQQLNRIIAPATPQSVVLIRTEKKSANVLRFLGAVPIVRHIMVTSLFFLLAFITIGQMKIINETNLNNGILGSSSWTAVAILSYLICCAGLGACFTSLHSLNNFVSKATYDPRYDSTYWASILLGVIAGVFISELLFNMLFPEAVAGDTTATADMGKPALALLGGFSANMVYKILQRLVESAESLVKGDQSAINQANQTAQVSELKSLKKEMSMDVASQLIKVEKLLESDPNAAGQEVRSAIESLLGAKKY